MVIAAYPVYKAQGYSNLFRVVYSEGIMYYVVLIRGSDFIFSSPAYLGSIPVVIVANVAMLSTAPTNFVLFLMPLTRVIHATMASRTVLHVREVVSRRTSGIDIASYNDMDLDNSELSIIRFFPFQSASMDQDRTREG
ncbi:hypothetical protein L218DRAFT_719424 [Marasmius fiardii PR-910]|nr:hypothetical protein L218DRAFT_719424 [Marasmius fiardii PR-910]